MKMIMMMGLGEGTEDADAAVADEEEKDILKHHHYFVDKHLTLVGSDYDYQGRTSSPKYW